MNIAKINRLTLIKISGPDAETFLQGQLTSDITQLCSSWQYAGYCNPKGRLLALLQLWRQGDDFYALISADLSEATTKRLRMYVMRSKVTIEELHEYSLIGLLNRDSSLETLSSLKLISKPDLSSQSDLSASQHGDVIQTDLFSALIINDRALLVCNESATDISEENPSANALWLNSDINEGLPQIEAATTEQFIPQMLNLDILGGISFKKGCYTGQEIVARMHYLGKLKQRMFIIERSTTGNPENNKSEFAGLRPGDKIYNDPEHQKTVGNLVSVDQVNGAALAIIRLDSLDGPLQSDSNIALKLSKRQAYDLPA